MSPTPTEIFEFLKKNLSVQIEVRPREGSDSSWYNELYVRLYLVNPETGEKELVSEGEDSFH